MNKKTSFLHKCKERRLGQTLAVYLGSAWVFIEAINFLIDKYDWNTIILDVLILLVIFGLPAILIYTWFQQKFTTKAIIFQALNGIIALAVIVFTLGNPGKLDPSQLRLLKFKTNQKKLAESIKSLVVLPFDNYTGTDEFEYYVEGMHSGLIGDLGKISALRVISKTSSIHFKGVDMTIPEIASELNVDAIIEPSISCVGGDSVCVQIKLVSAFPEEQQLWVEDFRVAKDQILNFYNDVTKKISEEINIVLTPQEERLLAKSRTIDREAYDAYLKGLYFMEDMSKEAVYKTMENLNSAIEKNPDWAPLYVGLAKVWLVIASFSYESNSVAYQNVYDNLDKAVELDPNFSESHFMSAMIAYLNEWDWDKGEKEFIKALAINPSDAMSRIYYSHLLCILQRPEEALTQGQLALDLDPLNPLIQALYAALYQCVGDCKTAMTYYEKILAVDPQHALANENVIIAAYQCGEYERGWEAEKFNLIQKHLIEKDELNKIDEIFNSQGFIATYEAMVHHLEGLAESGNVDLINMIDPVTKAYYYYIIDQDDKAMKWLEKGFEMHHPIMPYLFTKIWDFSRLRENPRFIDIARKMNLPLPEE